MHCFCNQKKAPGNAVDRKSLPAASTSAKSRTSSIEVGSKRRHASSMGDSQQASDWTRSRTGSEATSVTARLRPRSVRKQESSDEEDEEIEEDEEVDDDEDQDQDQDDDDFSDDESSARKRKTIM
jgi:hypothetical protein